MSAAGSGNCSITFVGTATTLLRLGEFTVLTDPNFLHRGQWAYLGKGLVTRRRTEPALSIDDLPDLDAVVLSHLHGDHFDRIARRGLDRTTPVMTTPKAAGRLRTFGFGEAVGMRTWTQQTIVKGDASLVAVSLPARHSFGFVERLLPPVMGTLLEYRRSQAARPVRIYLSGDTLFYDDLEEIGKQFPSIDLAVVHLGGTRVLGALVSMDGPQGIDLLRLLRPRTAVPVHYDDYGVFKTPLTEFRALVRAEALSTEVRYLDRGQQHRFGPTD
ncbi:putative Zn-dependent hydrolase of beta-lactamase fold [Saccharomonospora marina XMU15]|uniref:Putative Zn-dependent hydrolase of beta-lactamase fold n=1 Tax=Saccharomonospora marina XMU15 TaxID=882083 RepID=H5X4V3_9PSEU|nr:MBL fold metallo-hydrolase [Saccharomonospora marina]EHR52232.1 putative Zn-dependent hydrolase of beta-lactamase fold [Saccharomonospora marina XMU15]